MLTKKILALAFAGVFVLSIAITGAVIALNRDDGTVAAGTLDPLFTNAGNPNQATARAILDAAIAGDRTPTFRLFPTVGTGNVQALSNLSFRVVAHNATSVTLYATSTYRTVGLNMGTHTHALDPDPTMFTHAWLQSALNVPHLSNTVASDANALAVQLGAANLGALGGLGINIPTSAEATAWHRAGDVSSMAWTRSLTASSPGAWGGGTVMHPAGGTIPAGFQTMGSSIYTFSATGGAAFNFEHTGVTNHPDFGVVLIRWWDTGFSPNGYRTGFFRRGPSFNWYSTPDPSNFIPQRGLRPFITIPTAWLETAAGGSGSGPGGGDVIWPPDWEAGAERTLTLVRGSAIHGFITGDHVPVDLTKRQGMFYAVGIDIPNPAPQPGFIFVGWATSQARANSQIVDVAEGQTFVMPAGNRTLFAVWQHSGSTFVPG